MKTNELMPLNPFDLKQCVRRLPKQVRALLQQNPRQACVAGGFIRAVVAGEQVNDVDIFAPSYLHASNYAASLANQPGESPRRMHKTDNATTIFGYFITPQIIHRWTFADVMDVVPSFDFTIACAVIFYCDRLNKWQGFCDPRFYQDLAAKRLVYRSPDREEEPGGSMLRVLKFYQRGYRMPLCSLAAVMARCVKDLNYDHEIDLADAIKGRLVAVDPQVDPDHEAHLPSLNEEVEEQPGA